MKGRADAQPFVGANMGCLFAERSVVDQSTRLVDNKEVEKGHEGDLSYKSILMVLYKSILMILRVL